MACQLMPLQSAAKQARWTSTKGSAEGYTMSACASSLAPLALVCKSLTGSGFFRLEKAAGDMPIGASERHPCRPNQYSESTLESPVGQEILGNLGRIGRGATPVRVPPPRCNPRRHSTQSYSDLAP